MALTGDAFARSESTRNEIDFFAGEYSKMQSAHNSLKVDLDRANYAQLKLNSRCDMLEKENSQLRSELSNCIRKVKSSLDRTAQHFSASDLLQGVRDENSKLRAESAEKDDQIAKFESELSSQARMIKEQSIAFERRTNALEEEQEELKAKQAREIRILSDKLKETSKAFQEQWQKTKDAQAQLSNRPFSSKTSEAMWKQKVLGLREEVQDLRSENNGLSEQINRLQASQPRSRAAATKRPRIK